MKNLINKTIESVAQLQGANVMLTFDDGSKAIVKVVALPEDLAEEEAPTAKPGKGKDAKSEPAKPGKGNKVKMTFEKLEDMDRDELEELVDSEDLDIKLKDYKNDDDGLRKAIAEELEIEIPKDEGGEEDLTWDDLKKMDVDELTELIQDEKLDVDEDDFEDDEEGLRKAIAKEMEIEIPKKKK